MGMTIFFECVHKTPFAHPQRILKGLVFLEIFDVKLKNSQKVSHFAPPHPLFSK